MESVYVYADILGKYGTILDGKFYIDYSAYTNIPNIKFRICDELNLDAKISHSDFMLLEQFIAQEDPVELTPLITACQKVTLTMSYISHVSHISPVLYVEAHSNGRTKIKYIMRDNNFQNLQEFVAMLNLLANTPKATNWTLIYDRAIICSVSISSIIYMADTYEKLSLLCKTHLT